MWDVAARRRIATGPPQPHSSSVAIAPGRELVAAKSTNGEIVVLGVPELDERARFAPGGALLAFGDWSAGIALAWPPLDGLRATREPNRCAT